MQECNIFRNSLLYCCLSCWIGRTQCTGLSQTERGSYLLIVLIEKQSSCSSSCFLLSFSLTVHCNCLLKVGNRGFPIDFVQSISVKKCSNVMNVWIAVTGLINGDQRLERACTFLSFFFKILFVKHRKCFWQENMLVHVTLKSDSKEQKH